MPLFSRKKSDKSSKPKRKSQFFDADDDLTIHEAVESNGEKRKSKSKFYDELPLPQATDSYDRISIGSAASHASSTSKTSQPPPPEPRVLGIETQGDLGQSQTKDVWHRRTSMLSRSFSDILHDQDLIGYFIQYMTSNDRGHLVRFWLDAENFTGASLSRIRVRSIHSVIESRPPSNLTESNTSTSSAQSGLAPSIHNGSTPSGSNGSTSSNSNGSTSSGSNGSTSSNSNGSTSSNSTDSELTGTKPTGSLSTGSNGRKPTAEDDLQERIKEDAVNIYSRYIALDCRSPIGITEELRNSTISKICSEDGKVDPLCFRDSQKFVENIFEKSYYKGFLESSFYRKYQVDMIVDKKLHLIDILYNENIMFYFLEFVEQENASALLQFWMAVDNFQTQLETDKYTASDAQSDAMILYEKYFSLQASEPLGFSDKIRMHVELNICREEGPLPDCFLIPKIIILETIEKTLFSSFINSQMYYRYLSELIGSHPLTDNQSGTPKIKAKKTHSRKGSNGSGHDTQSLGGQSIPDSDAGSLSSATESRLAGIDDDQPLWKRTQHRKSLGQLNEYGQYVSELELENVPDLSKNKGNRFSRKKKEKEDAQMAMAWEVAKMIISGITEEASVNGLPAIPVIVEPSDSSSSKVTEL